MKKLKASEVLRRYAAGERNFQRVDISGQSFVGQDLSGADFSEAEIRSTNFTNSTLTSTQFCGAKCGLQKYWAIFLIIILWLVSLLSGIVSHISVYFIAVAFEFQQYGNNIAGITALIMLIIFFVCTTQKDLVIGFFGAFATGVVASTITGFLTFIKVIPIATTGAIAAAGLSFVMTIGAIIVIILAGIAWTSTFIIIESRVRALTTSILGIIIFTVTSTGFGLERVISKSTESGNNTITSNIAITLACALATAMTSVYIGTHSCKIKYEESWIRGFAVAFAAIGGTSFRNTNLTESNFSSAKLKNTDFRRAKLTRIRWYKAQMLDRARPGDSYLQYNQVRKWLIGKGTNKNFDDQKLRGINLQGINLTGASFIRTDLSKANLQDTNLSKAQLIQTQLDGTNLEGTTLTAACIEDWNINCETNLNNVICDFIFLKKDFNTQTKESFFSERSPCDSKRQFKPGEFTKLYQDTFDTVNLIFSEGIDWKAVAYSLQNTQVLNQDTPIAIQSIENKGDGVILIKVNVPEKRDKGKIEGDFWQGYEFAQKSIKEQYEARLLDKDKFIDQQSQQINQLFYSLNQSQEKLGEIPKLMAEQPKIQQNFNAPVNTVTGNVEGNQHIDE